MKKLLIIFALSLVFCSYTNDHSQADSIPNTAYEVGEELDYLLYYGIMDGGTAKITLRKFPSQDNKIVSHAKVEAETIGIARMFIAINDVYESFFDESNCKPIKAVRNIHENKYKYYNEVLFDHETNRVKSKKSGVIDVPNNIYDIISSLYYMRRTKFNNLKMNDTISVMTYFADEIFPYQIVYKGKETISTKLGKYNALKFQPIVETGRVFKNEDDMRFWVSDDKNFLPLRIEFDMLVGSIKCDLQSHKGVKHPMNKVK